VPKESTSKATSTVGAVKASTVEVEKPKTEVEKPKVKKVVKAESVNVPSGAILLTIHVNLQLSRCPEKMEELGLGSLDCVPRGTLLSDKEGVEFGGRKYAYAPKLVNKLLASDVPEAMTNRDGQRVRVKAWTVKKVK